jgi:hypothetical protein
MTPCCGFHAFAGAALLAAHPARGPRTEAAARFASTAGGRAAMSAKPARLLAAAAETRAPRTIGEIADRDSGENCASSALVGAAA